MCPGQTLSICGLCHYMQMRKYRLTATLNRILNQGCVRLDNCIYFKWPLKSKLHNYKQATRGPTALSPFQGTRQWGCIVPLPKGTVLPLPADSVESGPGPHSPWSYPGGGGGGTSILKVTGTCRWTGYDFAVINISTGYLVALFRSSILAQGILWPSCAHQYWHRVSKSA